MAGSGAIGGGRAREGLGADSRAYTSLLAAPLACAPGGAEPGRRCGLRRPAEEAKLAPLAEAATCLALAAHAHGTDGIKAALRAGVDSIEHGSFLDEEAVGLFKETGAYLVPTLLAGATVVEMAQDPDYFPPAVTAKARMVGPVMIGRSEWRTAPAYESHSAPTAA